MAGMMMGMIRLVVEYTHEIPFCKNDDTRPDFITKFHFLYYSISLFGLSGIVIVIVSLLTRKIDEKHVSLSGDIIAYPISSKLGSLFIIFEPVFTNARIRRCFFISHM